MRKVNRKKKRFLLALLLLLGFLSFFMSSGNNFSFLSTNPLDGDLPGSVVFSEGASHPFPDSRLESSNANYSNPSDITGFSSDPLSGETGYMEPSQVWNPITENAPGSFDLASITLPSGANDTSLLVYDPGLTPGKGNESHGSIVLTPPPSGASPTGSPGQTAPSSTTAPPEPAQQTAPSGTTSPTEPTKVPEPASFLILGSGLVAWGLMRKKILRQV